MRCIIGQGKGAFFYYAFFLEKGDGRMKKRLLCALICLSMLLGMLPAVSLVTTAEADGYLTQAEIDALPLASTAAKDDGINAYKIDSVDELIAAASTSFVSHVNNITDTLTAESDYIHGKFSFQKS